MPCFFCDRQLTRPRSRGGPRPTDASKEHLQPLSRGGDDSWENRVTACYQCNTFTGDWDKPLKLAFRDLMAELGGVHGKLPARYLLEEDLRKRAANNNEEMK